MALEGNYRWANSSKDTLLRSADSAVPLHRMTVTCDQSCQRIVPTVCELKAAIVPPAGCHSPPTFEQRGLWPALKLRFNALRVHTRAGWSLTMDLTNVALALIAIGIVALIPIGCLMTRSHGPRSGVTTSTH
jgi:hypothetical protein